MTAEVGLQAAGNPAIDHLDLWSSLYVNTAATGRGSSGKVSLYGLQKLRELILELAVRGKLVPQDPNDEPATVLLEKISEERANLLKKGKLKKQKPLSPITETEQQFEIPNGWANVRFGNVAVIERGGSPRPIKSFLTKDPDGLNWMKIGDTDIGGKYISSTAEKIIKEGLSKTRMVYPGDFLLTNSMSFGRPYITKIEGCIHDGWLRISPATLINKDFLYWLLTSPFIKNSLTKLAAGAVVQNLNSDKVREVVILVPPVAEQHRIVAKVDELMALCDQLEQQQTDSLQAHQTLVGVLLHSLVEAGNEESTQQAWSRIAKHFDTLFTTEESIDQLKQTILQLAVMGRLVPQDSNDDPASSLLEMVAEEKRRLAQEGVIKRLKPSPEIPEEEKPFELPDSWEWARIGTVAISTDYGLSEKTFENPNGVPVLKMGDIVEGEVLLGGQKTVSSTVEGLPYLYLEDGDLLYNRTNSAELVGKTGIYTGESNSYTFASYLIRIRLDKQLVSPRYLNICMNSPLFRKTQIEPHLKQQCGQANVNGTIMRNMRVSIPPLAEQRRIVFKVDELMAICDTLKAHTQEAQSTQVCLANAVVEQAVS